MSIIPISTKYLWNYVRNCHHSLKFQRLKYTNEPICSKEIWNELWYFDNNIEYSLIFHYWNLTETLFLRGECLFSFAKILLCIHLFCMYLSCRLQTNLLFYRLKIPSWLFLMIYSTCSYCMQTKVYGVSGIPAKSNQNYFVSPHALFCKPMQSHILWKKPEKYYFRKTLNS